MTQHNQIKLFEEKKVVSPLNAKGGILLNNKNGEDGK
jgi:hypothetical protein